MHTCILWAYQCFLRFLWPNISFPWNPWGKIGPWNFGDEPNLESIKASASSQCKLLGCPGKEVRINGDRINGLFHLLTNGVYWGYKNPLILTIDPNFLRDPSSFSYFRSFKQTFLLGVPSIPLRGCFQTWEGKDSERVNGARFRFQISQLKWPIFWGNQTSSLNVR